MEGLNLHIVNGTITSDIEFKQVGTEKSVANFSVACNRTYKGQDGEKKQDTQFIRIECWGALATFSEKWLKKGSNIQLQGEVRTDSYEKDGVKKYSTKTLARTINFLPDTVARTQESTTSAEEAKAQVNNLKNESPSTNQPAAATQAAFTSDEGDDLPF